jgi:hypothetical protein
MALQRKPGPQRLLLAIFATLAILLLLLRLFVAVQHRR